MGLEELGRGSISSMLRRADRCQKQYMDLKVVKIPQKPLWMMDVWTWRPKLTLCNIFIFVYYF